MLHWFAKRLREMQEVRRDERGFTLIELLVVVIIIGILAAIAIPTFLNQRARAQVAECRSDTRNAAAAATAYFAQNNTYAGMSTAAGGNLDTNFGFNPSANTTVTVNNADANSYDLTATCANGQTVTYDSNVGRVTGP
jgi:type IV pilus assembly protein PilA